MKRKMLLYISLLIILQLGWVALAFSNKVQDCLDFIILRTDNTSETEAGSLAECKIPSEPDGLNEMEQKDNNALSSNEIIKNLGHSGSVYFKARKECLDQNTNKNNGKK